MRLSIQHRLTYRFERSLYCDPFTIRLRPRSDERQTLLRYALSIFPEPTGWNAFRDLEGNVVARAWFSEKLEEIRLVAQSEVETAFENPFNFLLESDCVSLPWPEDRYDRSAGLVDEHAEPRIDRLCRQFLDETSCLTVGCLAHAAAWIREHHAVIRHPTGHVQSPATTLDRRCGSSRDLAFLFMEFCRRWRLNTRFVNGYFHCGEETVTHDWNSWCEVYLPGAGWRAIDPSTGLFVLDRHVAVAAAVQPEEAGPLSCSLPQLDSSVENTAEVEIRSLS